MGSAVKFRHCPATVMADNSSKYHCSLLDGKVRVLSEALVRRPTGIEFPNNLRGKVGM
jgi:hypothetical protein